LISTRYLNHSVHHELIEEARIALIAKLIRPAGNRHASDG